MKIFSKTVHIRMFNSFKRVFYEQMQKKLDRVGPFDSRPTTNKLHLFSKEKIRKIVGMI